MPPCGQVVFGENGHAEIAPEAFGNTMLALFDKLVRALPEHSIRKYIKDILLEDDREHNEDQSLRVKNLFLLVFQTRNCRGGKGEKRIAFLMLKILYDYFPTVVLELVSLLPHYGTWKDPLSLLLVCHEENVVEEYSCAKYQRLEDVVWRMYGKQLSMDHQALTESAAIGEFPDGISLCAKFAPSENGHHSKLLKADEKISKYVTTISTHNDFTRQKLYRKMNSALRSHLDITEQKMCGQNWSKIDFAKVPSLCFDRHKLNFLNEKKKPLVGKSEEYMLDRVKCQENLVRDIQTKGVNAIKGKQLFIHELVAQALKEHSPGRETVDQIINIQYQIVKDSILEIIEKRRIDNMDSSTQSNNMICMSDTSGSMTGDESILVSLGLGILVSEITNEKYRNMVMTFETEPHFHLFQDTMSFTQKVQSLMKASWGGSTNILAAMKLLIDLHLTGKINKNEVPDIIIISDMAFDESIEQYPAKSSWDCIYTEIKQLFSQHEIAVPKIVFWNVRCSTVGLPVGSDVEGVTMLSGFSQNLFKYVFSGELEQEVVEFDENGAAITTKRSLTAGELFDNVLRDKDLDLVRSLLDTFSNECFFYSKDAMKT